MHALSQQLADNSKETAALREIFKEFTARMPIVSLNDTRSQSAQERLVSMTDSQRLSLHGAIDQYQSGLVMADVHDRKQKFTDTAWGRASVIVGILTGLIVAAGVIFTVVHTLQQSTPTP